jgi:phage gp36-like protein
MATYCTSTSLQTLMIGTEFDSATTSLAVISMVDAENEIDKYLSKRYDMTAYNTSTSVPPMITTWAQRLSMGYMYQHMSRGGAEAMERGQAYIDNVIENLKLVAEGKADLIDSAGDVISDMSTTSYRVMSSTTDYAPTFNEDSELDWKQDEDKLDAIDSERY